MKKREKNCKGRIYIGFDFVKEMRLKNWRGVLCKKGNGGVSLGQWGPAMGKRERECCINGEGCRKFRIFWKKIF